MTQSVGIRYDKQFKTQGTVISDDTVHDTKCWGQGWHSPEHNMHGHRERQRQRQTDTERVRERQRHKTATERQTQTQTDRQTDKEG